MIFSLFLFVAVFAIAAGIQTSFHVYHVVTKPKQLSAAMDLAKVAVEAAEHDAKLLKMDSATKYHQARLSLETLAKRIGLNLTEAETYALIHSVLYQYQALEAIEGLE